MRSLFGWVYGPVILAVVAAVVILRGLWRIGSGSLVVVWCLSKQDACAKQRAECDCRFGCIHNVGFSLEALVLLVGQWLCRHRVSMGVA